MTLMPVNRTSCEVVRSSNFGGSRWIGRASDRERVSRPSMVSPTTFITRPRICAPTGIAMGWPVGTAAMPRLRPSVESIATQRTVSSPMCCCTSTTSVRPFSRLISSASWIRGSSPSSTLKCTSTTGPTTWVIYPVELIAIGYCFGIVKVTILFGIATIPVHKFYKIPFSRTASP